MVTITAAKISPQKKQKITATTPPVTVPRASGLPKFLAMGKSLHPASRDGVSLEHRKLDPPLVSGDFVNRNIHTVV